MTPKGFGKGQWEAPRRKACFGRGSLDQLQRNCPKTIAVVEEVGVRNVSSRSVDDDEVIIIGNVNAAEVEDEAKLVYPKEDKKKRRYRKFMVDKMAKNMNVPTEKIVEKMVEPSSR